MTKIAFLPLAYGYEVCPPLARWRADELSVIEKHPTLLQGVDVVCIFYLWCIFNNHVCKKATAASKILVHCQASLKCKNASAFLSEFVDQIAIAVTTIIFNRTALSFAGENGIAAVSIIMYLQFLFTGIYFGFSMGIATPLGYAYGNKRVDVCKILERYAYRFFMVAPIVIYILTYSLAPLGVSFFSDSTSPVFSLAVSGTRIYGLGFLFSGINIFSAIRLMSYEKGHLSGLLTFLRSFVLLILFLTILPVKFGLYGLWSAMPDAEFLTLFISIPLLKWKPSAFSQK